VKGLRNESYQLTLSFHVLVINSSEPDGIFCNVSRHAFNLWEPATPMTDENIAVHSATTDNSPLLWMHAQS